MKYRYIRHIPASPLASFIGDLYYMGGSVSFRRLKVFPLPSIHLMVNLGSAFQVYGSEPAKPVATCRESWCVGLWNQYHLVDWPEDIQLYGIHFKPGGAYPFSRQPLSELHNRVVPLEAIWGQTAAEIRERLSAAPTVPAGFGLLEQALLARLSESQPGLSTVQAAVAAIDQRHGTLSISDLSDQMGISQNHLGTQLKRWVGIPAKELARLYRFSYALGSVDPAQPADWTWVAYQAGYYDQAHFNKDFRAFTGHSPSDYLRLRGHAQNMNPETGENMGQLPVG